MGLKDVRESMGTTAEQMAARMGITVEELESIEKGKKTPRL